MTLGVVLSAAAAVLSFGLAVTGLIFQRRSLAGGFFAAGMLIFAVDAVLAVLSLRAQSVAEVWLWQSLAYVVEAFLPAVWLAFSLAYSRGTARDDLALRWWWLVAALVVPVGLAVVGRGDVAVALGDRGAGGFWIRPGFWTRVWQLVMLISFVAVLVNVERTFRAAVGTMQWRIKFVVLGLSLIFGVRIYCHSQALLFTAQERGMVQVETGALLLGGILLVVGHIRHGFGEIDIYPSRTVLQTSVVLLLVGGYLFVVGVLAQLAAHLGGFGSFEFQSLVVLLGVVGLALLLFSQRLRQHVRLWVARHFRRPQHDSRVVWTQFTRRLSAELGEEAYMKEAVQLVASTFDVLSVTLWRVEAASGRLVFAESTADRLSDGLDQAGLVLTEEVQAGLREVAGPFDLDRAAPPWAGPLALLSLRHFENGGTRQALPLMVGDRCKGLLILADRVNGRPWSVEEQDLLRCIGDQVAAGLLRLGLTEDLMQGREMQAFQTMSTFFVHDLKNAASSLGLMLQNLPEHFDDPEFRADALRAIGGTVGRINQIIERLGALRHNLELKCSAVDLNALVEKCVLEVGGFGDIEVARDLQPLPLVGADMGQLTTVVTNLLINAREAMGQQGCLTVATALAGDRVVMTVSDTGCGMSAEFIRKSLFRPFQTTKKKGLGIGMFQSKLIIEAHRGNLQVQSTPGSGSTFRMFLPITPTPQ